MTPAARIAAAIEVLDRTATGPATEQVLTQWARSNRYAGSGDRAAIRDLVFDGLRCRRSYGWLGGAETGRGLMIGGLRSAGVSPEGIFTGEGYAPPVLTDDEALPRSLADAPDAVRLDCPDWLLPVFRESLGANAEPVLIALQSRAPVFLRVNLRKTSVAQAISELADAGIVARSQPLSPTALEVTEHPRRVQTSPAYLDGKIELQDAASQAIMDLVPLRNGLKVLDYCAGGGGKSLALAGRADLIITAHDIAPERMRDLPTRAARADVAIAVVADMSEIDTAGYDLVLCDVPCSGSGAWRRSPDAKWTLTPSRLAELQNVQAAILDAAADHVAPGGILAYATCSVFESENRYQAEAFLLRRPEWTIVQQKSFTPLDGGDGFYIAVLTRSPLKY